MKNYDYLTHRKPISYLHSFILSFLNLSFLSEVFRHFGHLGIHLVDELLDGLDTLLATALRTYGDGAIGCFLLADNHHVGDALQLVVADLTTQLLVAQVDGGSYPTLAELTADLLGIVVVFL